MCKYANCQREDFVEETTHTCKSNDVACKLIFFPQPSLNTKPLTYKQHHTHNQLCRNFL